MPSKKEMSTVSWFQSENNRPNFKSIFVSATKQSDCATMSIILIASPMIQFRHLLFPRLLEELKFLQTKNFQLRLNLMPTVLT